MIAALSLVPFAWWASAAPITISEVSASREGGRMVVDIAAEAMVDPESASAKISDGRVLLFIGDTRVRADNRAWGEGADRILAHRHRRLVELVVPMGDGGACQGPVELVKASGGLRAVIGCDSALDGARAARPKGRPAAVATETASAPVVKASALAAPSVPPPSTRKPESARETRELQAVLGLDEPAREETAPAQAPLAPAPRPPGAAVAPPLLVALPVADRPPAAGKPVAGKPAVDKPALAPVGPGPAPAAVMLADTAGHGGLGVGFYLAGGLLALLAGAAYVFNRRRVAVPRLVKIIETASLGPKRAIVVARIGGETMILGTSEAGITVLQARPEAAAAVARAVESDDAAAGDEPDAPEPASPAALAGEIPDADVDADPDEPLVPVQGGLLARLFRRGRPANESEFHNFEELLEDSLEDQELRQKLSMGMAGRVP